MNVKKPHKRQAGEFEIRVLRDGKVVMIAPDETLLQVAKNIKNGQLNTKGRKLKGNRSKKKDNKRT
jgi:hypothetical protein